MKHETISRAEYQIKSLFEGSMAGLLKGCPHPNEIQVQIVNAMEDQAELDERSGKMIAPDHYFIHLHPRDHQEFFERYPEIVDILKSDLVEIARNHDLILFDEPTLVFIPNTEIKKRDVSIQAKHGVEKHDSTKSLRVNSLDVAAFTHSTTAELINDKQHIPLSKPVMSIGRHRDNDIILDDMIISRHHAQIRWRAGEHLMIDLNSQNGTFVNGTTIVEKGLRTGDVISIGKNRLIYVCDTGVDEVNDETRPITEIL